MILINKTRPSTSLSSSNGTILKSNQIIKTYFSSKQQCLNQHEFGFLFDIDGVLIRGKQILPRSKECIKLLTDSNGDFKYPTVFVTNAANELRSSKSIKLSNILGCKVSPEQVVMSHSPLKMFKSFHSKHCLISGQGPIIEIAKNLGFSRITTIDDLRQSFPNLDVVDHKRRSVAPCVLGRYFPPIEAILLFGEPVRWETNLQLILDVLLSNGKLDPELNSGQSSTTVNAAVMGSSMIPTMPYPHLPILACNTDFVWMSEAHMPRFGHGTFLHCLEQIYEKLSGYELKYTGLVGKPATITYSYAERCLHQHSKALLSSNGSVNGNGSTTPTTSIKRIYAIGDNIDTDIYGANLYDIYLNNKKLHKKIIRKQRQHNNQNDRMIDDEADDDDAENNDDELSKIMSESKIDTINSILVCTGVYRGGINGNASITNGNALNNNRHLDYGHKDLVVNDPTLKQARHVCIDVYDAVELVLNLEKILH